MKALYFVCISWTFVTLMCAAFGVPISDQHYAVSTCMAFYCQIFSVRNADRME